MSHALYTTGTQRISTIANLKAGRMQIRTGPVLEFTSLLWGLEKDHLEIGSVNRMKMQYHSDGVSGKLNVTSERYFEKLMGSN